MTIITLARPPHPKLRRLASEAGHTPESFVVCALRDHRSIGAAAEACGVSRQAFSRWMDRLGVRAEYAE